MPFTPQPPITPAGTSIPAGTIVMFGAATAPTGWLLCDGAEVSQTTFADLFDVLGADAYGTDAGGNFFLPDFASAFPRGNTITASGGSDDAIVVTHLHATNTSNQDLNHTHTVNPATHAHGISTGDNTAGTIMRRSTSFVRTGTTNNFNLPLINSGNQSASHQHTVTVVNQGSSGTDKNIPAFVGVAFIIKT